MKANTKETRLGMILYIDELGEMFRTDRGNYGFYAISFEKLKNLLYQKLGYKINLEGLLKHDQSPWEKFYGVPMKIPKGNFDKILNEKYGSANLETFKKWKEEWITQGFAKRIRQELEENSFGQDEEFQTWKKDLLFRVFESEYERDKPPDDRPTSSEVKEIESTEDSTLIPDAKFYFGDKTLLQFERFVADAKNSLQILTHSISYDAVERVFANIGPIDSVEIVTFRRHGTKRIREFLIKKGVKKVKIKRLQYLHAKFCIQDGKKILVSSANITVKSQGRPTEGGFVEASIVSSNESTVKKALALFEAVVKEETVQTIEAGPVEDFLSSAYGIPERILGVIRGSREICIIVPPFIDDYIFSVIQSTIQSTDIKIVTTWPSKASKNNRNGLLLLNKFGDFKLVDFVPVRQQIHAKVYVFTLTNGKKTAFISSMNMMRNSWYANVEAGVLTEDENIITAIDHVVSRLMRVTTVNSPEIMSPTTQSGGNGEEEELPELVLMFAPEGQEFVDNFNKQYQDFRAKYKNLYEEAGIPVEERSHQIDKDFDAEDTMEKSFIFEEGEAFPGVATKADDVKKQKQKIDGMGYIHCALLLHYAKKDITRDGIERILKELDVIYEPTMIDALISSIKNINIGEAMIGKK
jgi:hypothetical protein